MRPPNRAWKALFASLLSLAALLVVLTLWWMPFMGEDDCNPLNPRYVLWKWGVAPLPKDILYGALARDPGRDDVVRGQTLAELRAMLGDVRVTGLTEHQADQDRHATGERAWLGESWLRVRFIEGRAVSVGLAKG